MNQISELEVSREELLSQLNEYISIVQNTDVSEVVDPAFFGQLQDVSAKAISANMQFMRAAIKAGGTRQLKASSYLPYELCFIPS